MDSLAQRGRYLLRTLAIALCPGWMAAQSAADRIAQQLKPAQWTTENAAMAGQQARPLSLAFSGPAGSQTVLYIVFFILFCVSVAGAAFLLIRIIVQARADRLPGPPRSSDSGKAESCQALAQDASSAVETSLDTGTAEAPAGRNREAPPTPEATLSGKHEPPAPGSETGGTAADSGPDATERFAAGTTAAPSDMPPAEPTRDRENSPAGAESLHGMMQEGMRLARAGRKAEAYDAFSAVTRMAPKYVEAWLWKGAAALHPQESVRCLQQALALDPDNRRAREGLAWALARLSALEEPAEEE